MGESADSERPTILHCFADLGAESEILSNYGDVLRIGIDPRDLNESTPIRADADIDQEGKGYSLPLREDVQFDLGFFHPVCSRWAATTSISGDPEEHVNMIPSARTIGERYCEHYVVENVPRAPLREPVVLDGRMFGLPIEFERAFETTFDVPQPPRQTRFVHEEGISKRAETSTFFFTERSRSWWASVKFVPPGPYPKQHLAKNTIPGAYVHHVVRAWLRVYEGAGTDIDYSNYDQEMQTRRRREKNTSLEEYR